MTRRTGPVFGAVLNAVCTYESVALNARGTRLAKYVPPISHGLWRLHPVARAGVVGVFVAALVDHFFTRRFS